MRTYHSKIEHGGGIIYGGDRNLANTLVLGLILGSGRGGGARWLEDGKRKLSFT